MSWDDIDFYPHDDIYGRDEWEMHYDYAWEDVQRRIDNLARYGQMDTPPVQGCRDLTVRRTSSLNLWSEAIHAVYADGLRREINATSPLLDLVRQHGTVHWEMKYDVAPWHRKLLMRWNRWRRAH